jgi:SAM-dependent methyltransferase
MFFPDKVQGYREARRVLKPGAPFFFSVWDRIEDNEFADVVTEALAEMFPNDPPLFMARTPHGYHDLEKIRGELKAAGFADVAVDTVMERSRAPSPRDVAIAYCQGTPLRGEIESRGASGVEAATRKATDAIAKRFGGGAVDGRIQAHIITAAG